MKIFLSHASEDRSLAREIQLALLGSGHQVFFDRESLLAGGDFHTRIREEVNGSDLFIFLISPHSLSSGKYTLSELRYAEKKWLHPREHVLPVMIERVPFEHINEYLKAVTILEPAGNIAAEVAAEVAAKEELNAKSPPSVTSIAGSWRDPNFPSNGSRIIQDGNSFRFNGWGVLPNGIPFITSGSGTVTGQNITSTCTTTYHNGWVSNGECMGTASLDGSRMTSTCTDNILGTFVSSGVRESNF
jgi:hypothetical protein